MAAATFKAGLLGYPPTTYQHRIGRLLQCATGSTPAASVVGQVSELIVSLSCRRSSTSPTTPHFSLTSTTIALVLLASLQIQGLSSIKTCGFTGVRNDSRCTLPSVPVRLNTCAERARGWTVTRMPHAADPNRAECCWSSSSQPGIAP